MPPAPAIPDERSWPAAIATTALGFTWWALKTLAVMGSVAYVAYQQVDWQQMVMEPVLAQAFYWASSYIDSIDAETVKGYADQLIDALKQQVGKMKNLPNKAKQARLILTTGESVAALLVGMGSEWWVSRKKHFSFTRGTIYSIGIFGALKALELDAYAGAAFSGSEEIGKKLDDLDWDGIRRKIHEKIESRMGYGL